jgi:hypothetical protein
LGVLLAAEHRGAAVGPGEGLGAVVGRIHHDGVVGDAELVELREQLADLAVVLDHAVGVDAEAGHPLRCRLEVGEDVHARRVPPQEERLAVGLRLVDEGERLGRHLLVDGFHARARQRAGVLDLLGAVGRGRGPDHPARTKLPLERGILGIVGVLRLLFGVQVVEVAEEFIEAMDGRQHVVAITQVVLAKLPR